MNTRLEHDVIGTLEVPAEAYYGVHALRSLSNFPMTGEKLHPEMIRALAQVKKAAALSNMRAGILEGRLGEAIARACDEILAGGLMDSFIVDPIQGGAGTSANMNANEVIANRALELLGEKKGDYRLLHPNDHVNLSQSTNDVYPTAGKIALLRLLEQAQAPLTALIHALEGKAGEFENLLKPGRTQLQDAVPTRLGRSFAAYAQAISRCLTRLTEARQELLTVNLGGTAIGTSANAAPAYVACVVPILAELTGLPLRQADDLIDGTQHIDCFVPVSAAIKACAIALSKMSNDLRLLSSGPGAGLGEIRLPSRQNGSSIMPGKVNPVIPEVVTQAAMRIAGNDITVSMAAEAGQLELNAFEPVLFYSLFQSADLLRNAADTLWRNCVCGITANEQRLKELLAGSNCAAAALCPHVGYERASAIVKESLKSGKTLSETAAEALDISLQEAEKILAPAV